MHNALKLPYGKDTLDLYLDPSLFDVSLILPHEHESPPLKNPEKDFYQKAKAPIGTNAIRVLASPNATDNPSIIIVVSDHTRPVPDRPLIPWIVSELNANDHCISLLVATGTHRPPTPQELRRMLGSDIYNRFEVIIHDYKDTANLTHVGDSTCGGPCLLNKRYVEADVKIATGFIEPHFFAGFSGGSKAIVPGIAGLETISHFHRARIIADPLSTWGITHQNPVLNLSREMTSLCPPDCIINITMNQKKQITGFFIGHYIRAHDSGCEKAAEQSFTRSQRKFPVVITTNNGYPLDMNFYQTVKGISAASRIVEEGGTIIVVSECGNGIPDNSDFEKMLYQDTPTDDLLNKILASDTTPKDQWQVQVLLQILEKYKVLLYSSLNKHTVRRARIEPTADIEKELAHLRQVYNKDRLSVAVLPYGPLTIPVN